METYTFLCVNIICTVNIALPFYDWAVGLSLSYLPRLQSGVRKVRVHCVIWYPHTHYSHTGLHYDQMTNLSHIINKIISVFRAQIMTTWLLDVVWWQMFYFIFGSLSALIVYLMIFVWGKISISSMELTAEMKCIHVNVYYELYFTSYTLLRELSSISLINIR